MTPTRVALDRLEWVMPKFVDYAGRFAFFEEAALVIVRDHGVDQLSRHRVAKVLGSSISTIRRTLSSRSDLRKLALNEVEHRRRSGRYGQPRGHGVDAAADELRRLLPDAPERVAEELVWWRLVIAAPRTPTLAPSHDDLEEGPLHHRFAISSFGFVPLDVLNLQMEPPRAATDSEGRVDPIVKARVQREAGVAGIIADVLRALVGGGEPDAGDVSATHALLDGLSLAVVLGRLTPADALGVLHHHLAGQKGSG